MSSKATKAPAKRKSTQVKALTPRKTERIKGGAQLPPDTRRDIAKSTVRIT